MENLLIVLSVAAILTAAYCGVIALKRVSECEDGASEQGDMIVSMAHEIATLKTQIEEITAAYEEAQELIEATKEYTQEATNREILMQNGINSILGYDAMSALKGGGNKE